MKKKSGINVDDMLPANEESPTNSAAILPKLGTDEETEVVDTGGAVGLTETTAAVTINDGTDSSGEKTDTTPRRKGWGEVMILEKTKIPTRTDGSEYMDAYTPVEEFDLDTGSTADAEKWLLDRAERGDMLCSEYTIIRRVKTLRLKEVRQILVEEIEG